ncbi:MAG: YqaE/Pmp3 family membrane protein [Sphingomonadaceae bacterium]|nr:YqaE/Pmp3 family membrane protein [Sphingomonadaceae bacterium]
MKALQIVTAVLVPPVGVFLKRGISAEFWIAFALTLAFFVPGLVYALVVVLKP